MIAKAVVVLSVVLFQPFGAAMAGDLHKAARKGDLEAVLSLISDGAVLGEVDKAVGTPLHWAAARGHAEIVKALLEAGAPVDAAGATTDKMRPIQMAASGGSVDAVALLIDAGADLSYGASEGSGTPLHIAAGEGHVDVVRRLLDAGADPYAEVGTGYATLPVHWAAFEGQTDVVAMFLDAGVPIDAASGVGTTSLHLAVRSLHAETARFLIENGADADAFSELLDTPKRLAGDSDEMTRLFTSLGLKVY